MEGYTIEYYGIENGDITREVIANESPFDGFDWLNVFGNNVNVIPKYVDELHVHIPEHTHPLIPVELGLLEQQ